MASVVAEKFWMVQGVGGIGAGTAAVRHKFRVDATNEAKRLAKLHRTTTFYVMEAQYGYVASAEAINESASQHVTVQILGE